MPAEYFIWWKYKNILSDDSLESADTGYDVPGIRQADNNFPHNSRKRQRHSEMENKFVKNSKNKGVKLYKLYRSLCTG